MPRQIIQTDKLFLYSSEVLRTHAEALRLLNEASSAPDAEQQRQTFDEFRKLKSEIDRRNFSIQAAMEVVRMLESQIQNLQSQVAISSNDLDSLRAEADRLKGELANAQVVLDALREKCRGQGQ